MRKPAFGRTVIRTRRTIRRVAAPVVESIRSGTNWAETRLGSERSNRSWQRVWLTRNDVRWRKAGTVVECFGVADGYLATVEYTDRNVTWQLTKGPVPLASALAVVALYLQYEVTPHIDPDGRMFVATVDGRPIEALRDVADRPFEYHYLDGYSSLDELPDWVDRTDLDPVYSRLAQRHRRELPPG